MAEETLAVEEDEGFAEVAVDLAAEGVEVVGGCGWVDELPVAVLDLAAFWVRLIR